MDLIYATNTAIKIVGIVVIGVDRLDHITSRRAVHLGEHLIRFLAGALGALLLTLPAQAVAAQDLGLPTSPRHEAARLMSAELLMSTSLAQRAQLTQPGSSSLMDRVRFDMAVAAADYSYRVGARQEQLRVYELASYYSVENSVIPLLPASISTPVEDAIAGLHSPHRSEERP